MNIKPDSSRIWDNIIEKTTLSKLPGAQHSFRSTLESMVANLADKILSSFSSAYIQRRTILSHEIMKTHANFNTPAKVQEKVDVSPSEVGLPSKLDVSPSELEDVGADKPEQTFNDLPPEILRTIFNFNKPSEKVMLQSVSKGVGEAAEESIKEMGQEKELLTAKQIAQKSDGCVDFIVNHFSEFQKGTLGSRIVWGEVYLDDAGDIIGIRIADKGYLPVNSGTISSPHSDDNGDNKRFLEFRLNYQWDPSINPEGPFKEAERFEDKPTQTPLTKAMSAKVIAGLNAKALKAQSKAEAAGDIAKDAEVARFEFPTWLKYWKSV